MDYNTFNALAAFRHGLYGCFHRAGDALMNINDALPCEVSARSFVELSLSPFFARGWPSLYEGLQDAVIDRAALQKLYASQVPLPAPGQRLVLGVDASSIARPQSPTARDRTYVHAANLPEGSKPVVAGWQYSALCVLPQTSGSWTYVLDNQRITPIKPQKPRNPGAGGRKAIAKPPAAVASAPPFAGRWLLWQPKFCVPDAGVSLRQTVAPGQEPHSVPTRPTQNRQEGRTQKRRDTLCLRPAANTRHTRPRVARGRQGRATLRGCFLAEPTLQASPRRDAFCFACHPAPGDGQQARPAHHPNKTSVGLCSAASPCRPCPKLPASTDAVTAWNTATGWINKTCSGPRRACGRRKPLTTGHYL